MNPYERHMLVQHQTSSLIRDADQARLARQAGRPVGSENVLATSRTARLRAIWTSAAARVHPVVNRANGVEADVTGHISQLTVQPARPA